MDAASPSQHTARRQRREVLVLLALIGVLLGPFLLRPAVSTTGRHDRRLVVLTPHPERLRAEFGQAFARYWRERTGEAVRIDWRVPGGTSEIAVLLKSEFNAAFEDHWTRELGLPWTAEVARQFLSGKAPADDPARRAFLASSVGIGVDLFFGGGAYDFQVQAEAGTLVAGQGPGTGLAALRERHPDWFSEAGIPESVSGEPFRDAADRWVACCLSSFGMVFNRDVLRRLGITQEPRRWRDLADPRLSGQLALADPGRSATVTKAFEMLLQQEMQEAVRRHLAAGAAPEMAERQGVREGWDVGLALIQRLSANARYYSDSSSKIPLDVARGDAAAGLCIDYYGRSTEEALRREGQTPRVGFVMPEGGSSVSVDPIGLLRGAPDPELATAFMEFVLGDPGQRLWSFRAGAPGGPAHTALRRLAARRDFYIPENLAHMSDADELPYEKARHFTYHAEWTGAVFSTLRFLIRVICVDAHREQRAAWRALVEAGFPPEATAVFHDLSRVGYDEATGAINAVVRSRDKVAETRLARELGEVFRANYRRAEQLARAGR
jgi:iron(III) transport system substrate-binding protein